MKQKFYGILRVSTESQKDTNLGLLSQKENIENYVKSVGGELIGFSEEVLSGGYKEKIVGNVSLETLLKPRPQLMAAIEICKKEKAVLICKESSRISRSPLVIEFLINSGITFIATDSPQDNPLLIRIKAAIHAQELTSISERTKAALAQRKKQLQETGMFISKSGNVCKRLGNNNLKEYNKSLRAKRPSETAVKMLPYVKSLRENGLTLEMIAQRLNGEKFVAPLGGAINKATVWKILKIA